MNFYYFQKKNMEVKNTLNNKLFEQICWFDINCMYK